MIVHVHVKLSTVRRCTIAVSIGMRCELTGGRRNGTMREFVLLRYICLASQYCLCQSRGSFIRSSWRELRWGEKCLGAGWVCSNVPGASCCGCRRQIFVYLVSWFLMYYRSKTMHLLLVGTLLLSRIVATADDPSNSTTSWIVDGTVTRRVASICLVQQTHRIPLTASLAAS